MDELVERIRRCSYLDPNGGEVCRDCPNREDFYECKQKLALQAADVIEKLQKQLAFEEQNAKAFLHTAHKLLDELPRWIPVTERLPSYGDWVLGIGPKKGYYVCEYRGVTHWRRDGCDPRFSAKGSSVTITHWMPLPEPPKEG